MEVRNDVHVVEINRPSITLNKLSPGADQHKAVALMSAIARGNATDAK
jgi:hypothetical protein